MNLLVPFMFSREVIITAIGLWERARVLFNVVLLAYVLARFGDALSALPNRLWPEIIFLAAVANILFCIAYPIDIVAQATDYRYMWQTAGRPTLWVALLLLIGALVHISLAHMLHGA